jgi:ABC-type antimicrobial peptide transport system, ATPase component
MPNNKLIAELLKDFNGNKIAAVEAIRHFKQPDSNRPPANATPIIRVDQLTKTYKFHRKPVEVLKGLTFDVYEGEFLVLAGSSGSGKSTLLHLLGGLDKPTSGTITVGNQNISKLSDSKLSEFRGNTIGFVFQSFYLQPFLSLGDNVEVPGMFARRPRAKRHLHAQNLLKLVGLDEHTNYLPKQLSGGQLQRTAIARAILNNPKILLADEPTGNLDATNSRKVIEVFKRIQKTLGTTIVMVTHDPDIAMQADRVLNLADGEII